MSEVKTCSHTLDNGEPCRAIAVRNTPYCYFHRKYYQPPALPGDKNYQAPLLESNHAIQIALTHLYQSFLSRKIDLKGANFSLQILRLASKTVAAIEKARKEAGQPTANFATTAQTPSSDGPSIHDLFNEIKSQMIEDSQPVSSPETGAAARKPPQPVTTEPKRGVYDPEGCLAPIQSLRS